MRSVYFFLVILIAVQVSDILGAEVCPSENCLEANKCEILTRGLQCANGANCCSVVKSKFRTACRHHGGECMENCNADLKRSVNDCPADTVCCVLV